MSEPTREHWNTAWELCHIMHESRFRFEDRHCASCTPIAHALCKLEDKARHEWQAAVIEAAATAQWNMCCANSCQDKNAAKEAIRALTTADIAAARERMLAAHDRTEREKWLEEACKVLCVLCRLTHAEAIEGPDKEWRHYNGSSGNECEASVLRRHFTAEKHS